MADFKEVRVERLYVKVPNSDKLRKTAAGQHKHLLAAGWREVDRRQDIDHVSVRYERAGLTPLKYRLPRPDTEAQRMDRRGGRGRGGPGGPGGRGRGGRGR
jgi:hypothetical protein